MPSFATERETLTNWREFIFGDTQNWGWRWVLFGAGVRPELLSSPNTDVMLRKTGPVLVTQRQEHRPCEVDLKPRTAFTLSHQTASLNNSNYTIVAPTKAAWKIKPRTNWERSFFRAASIVLLKSCTQGLNLQFHPNIFFLLYNYECKVMSSNRMCPGLSV